SVPGLAKDTRLPILIDETLLVLGLRAPGGGEGIATLVNWNTHPSVAGGGNSEISADFPGALVARMEKEWGGTGLYVSGDLGGQIGSRRAKIRSEITGKVIPGSSMQLVEALGDKLAGVALGALDGAVSKGPEPAPRIDVQATSLRVPLDNPDFVQALALGVLQPRKLYPPGGDSPGWLPSALPDPSTFEPGAYDLASEAAVVDLGSIAWALVPGELYPEIALGQYQTPQDPGADFQGAPQEPGLRALAGKPLFIVCLANDELGYIIPKSEWDSEPPYAYGRKEMQYGERVSAGPETAPLVMEAFQQMLEPGATSHAVTGSLEASGR
ncbi:MAG TPA: hypothetical protein VNI57_05850, partial [Candidatus Saccharimonadales bacterium]|nr:hypothetical protein [Candidatus Saccharimonadales bacterium]